MTAFPFEAYGLVAPRSCIHPPIGPVGTSEILDRWLVATPEAEALADSDRRYSYAELDAAADRAAHLLRSLGVESGDRIAASLPNGCSIVIAFLAAQRLGAVWVGINRVLSPAEKASILDHSGAQLLLTDTAGFDALAAPASSLPHLARVLDVERRDRAMWEEVSLASANRRFERPEIDPFAPAAIMYTSGTTGAPKGVVHSQHNLVTVCAGMSDAGIQRPDARRGVILPLTIANLMVIGPLMAFWNGQACICGTTLKPAALASWFAREKIGLCASVPTIVFDLLQADVDLPPSLDLRAGGAPLPSSIRATFLRRHGVPVGGSYGLTEAPTVVTETRGVEPPPRSSGLPLPHLELTIRDQAAKALPRNEVGEICVGAVPTGRWAGVYTPALGYWREPERSARLVRDGVLHTGDMGHLDEGGWLYVADRSSELILRAGSNIYPGEVERVLQDHSQVAACALLGKPDRRLGTRTVAFVQPTMVNSTGTLRSELIDHCLRTLARYKVPDEWIFLPDLPRNAMGKIIRQRLQVYLQVSDED